MNENKKNKNNGHGGARFKAPEKRKNRKGKDLRLDADLYAKISSMSADEYNAFIRLAFELINH